MEHAYPSLSLAERDRRWKLTRDFLNARGLDALLLFGLKSRERFEAYLGNDWVEGLVVFPANGNPVCLTWAAHRITRRLGSVGASQTFWIDDIRIGASGPGVVETLRELGLAKARLGVMGLRLQGPAEGEGCVPYSLWEHVLRELPSARFEDVGDAYVEVMLPKSEEEIVLVRKSAEIGEQACQRMLDVTRPGVSEHALYAAIMETIFSNGSVPMYPNLIISLAADDVGWGPPLWNYRGGAPRAVQMGDVVQAEIFPCYGGLESQQQMAVAVGTPTPVHQELADVARRAYDIGLEALRPGVTFREVNDRMYAPVREAGCWHLTPLIHSMCPLALTGQVGVGIEQLPGIERYGRFSGRPPALGDVVIQAGMVFELEPNACRGNRRVNIGGTVLVTANGAEELNRIPTRLQQVA